MAGSERLTAARVIEALDETQGLVFLAAEKLGCCARTVYNYAERYPTVKEALEEHKGKRLDTAEASLWRAVVAGEAWAVCFYLKTQGKHRGYVERVQMQTQEWTREELNAEIERELEKLANRRQARAAAAPPGASGDAPHNGHRH